MTAPAVHTTATPKVEDEVEPDEVTSAEGAEGTETAEPAETVLVAPAPSVAEILASGDRRIGAVDFTAPEPDAAGENPAPDDTAAEGPVAEGPVAEGPVAEGPVAEGPVAEDPVAEDPVAEDPATEEQPDVATTPPAETQPVAVPEGSEPPVEDVARSVLTAMRHLDSTRKRYLEAVEAELACGRALANAETALDRELKRMLVRYERLIALTAAHREGGQIEADLLRQLGVAAAAVLGGEDDTWDAEGMAGAS